MFGRRLRALIFCPLLLGLAWVAASTASASQIRLKSGDIYPDATILHRNANSLEIRIRYGTMVVPLELVDRIDGVPVDQAAPPAPARPVPTLGTALQSSRPPLAATPPISAPTATPAPQLAPPNVQPSPTLSAVENASPDHPSWLLDQFWPIVLIVFIVALTTYLWSVTLPRLIRDQRARPSLSRWWFVTVLALPGLGYLIYRVWCSLRRLSTTRQTRKPVERVIQEPFEFLDADHNPISIDTGSAVFSGIENARITLESALLKRASDVHIEPAAQEYRVRLRVDGSMVSDRVFSTAEGVRLVSALKTLAQTDIAEKRKAQDGRFGARQGSRTVDFRAATIPSVHGEKLVIRILDRKSGVRGLEDLGMPQEMMERFAQVVHSRSGMILATGPTGSGKTSTLYAALAQLDANQLNLVTIEDPVEYELAGATQIPVNAKAGVTYESGLRSILRQDPDVILVGEMRDLESAQIALRAALTGHLVFSSLHTRDAIGAVMRLEEMGIEPHLVASALFVVLSQRLVRVLCDSCRESYKATGNELLSLDVELEPGSTLYRAVGCRQCQGTGYLGRTGIFEMLVLDEEIRQPINNGIEEDDLLRLARSMGFTRYREDGAMKALLGITTVDEVLKAN